MYPNYLKSKGESIYVKRLSSSRELSIQCLDEFGNFQIDVNNLHDDFYKKENYIPITKSEFEAKYIEIVELQNKLATI